MPVLGRGQRSRTLTFERSYYRAGWTKLNGREMRCNQKYCDRFAEGGMLGSVKRRKMGMVVFMRSIVSYARLCRRGRWNGVINEQRISCKLPKVDDMDDWLR